MVRVVEHNYPLLPVRARDQAEIALEAGSYGSDSLAVGGWVFSLSGVREWVVGIEGFPLWDVRYVVNGYQRRWRVTVPQNSRGYLQLRERRGSRW